MSIYPEATVNILLQFISYLAVFFVTVNYLDDERKCKRLVAVIILTGFLLSLYGILIKHNVSRASYGTFTNRNHFAAYIQLIIPLSLSYALISKSKIKRVLLFFASSVMVTALFYSWSRAGRVSFLLGLFVFLILLRIKKVFGKLLRWVIILVIFLIILLGILGFSGFFSRLDTLNNPFQAYNNRFIFMIDSLRVVEDFPLFGTGLGTYPEIIQKYKTADRQVSYGFSHNEPVQLLSEAGITGFLIVSIFLFTVLFISFHSWAKRMNRFSVLISISCFTGVFSVLFHSFFDFVFRVPANAILFFIILGLGFRAAHTSSSSDIKIPVFTCSMTNGLKIVITGVILVCVILFGFLVINRCRAQLIVDKVTKMKFLGTKSDMVLGYKKAIQEIDTAIALNPLNSSYLKVRGDLFADLYSHEGIDIELSALDIFGTRERLILAANDAYKRAVNINPTKADYHLRLGWSYSLLGNPDLVSNEFNKALSLDPKNKAIKEYIDSLNPNR